MLGYISDDARGACDRLLLSVADQLSDSGETLAGAVQENLEADGLPRCDMVLRILGRSERIEISQRLGPLATGCRLDPDALERAVGLVESTLPNGVSLLIVNKFGKQEAEGRGFRHVIAEALVRAAPGSLLVFDEPTAGLHANDVAPLMEVLDGLVERGDTVVVVEHDMEFVRRLDCKVTVLHEGAVLAEGSIDHVTQNEEVIEVYIGR